MSININRISGTLSMRKSKQQLGTSRVLSADSDNAIGQIENVTSEFSKMNEKAESVEKLVPSVVFTEIEAIDSNQSKYMTLDHSKNKSDSMGNTITDSLSKKISNDRKRFDTLASVLEAVLAPTTDKKGNTKSSNFTQAHQDALMRIKETESLTSEMVKDLVRYVGITDPEFKKLLQILLLTLGNGNVSKVVLDFCVKAISENWIHKERGDTNLFLAEAETIGFSNPAIMAFLSKNFYDKYKNRIDKLKETLKIKEKGLPGSNPESEVRSLKPEQMRRQCENLLAICYLWAVETGKCEPKHVIKEFEKLFQEQVKDEKIEKVVCHFLAKQLDAPKNGVVEMLHYYNSAITTVREEHRLADSLRQRLQSQLIEANANKDKLVQETVDLKQKVADLEAQLNEAQTQAHEQKLDDKAIRVHLKDDVSQAKSRAFNLLNEEVVAPLRLSLQALQRENPKVHVAEHQVELVLESIERELEWFKK
ncbi:hypothetical protein ACVWV7_000444 [Aeromonas hydrophila]